MGVSTTMTLPLPSPAAAFRVEVVSRAQRGDDSARSTLASACFRTAYLFALQLTGHPQDAEDLAQEAVIRVLRGIGRFDTTRSFKPWLLTIVRNLARDRSRRAAHRLNQSLDGRPDEIVIDPQDRSDDPETATARLQLQRSVVRALAELGPAHREILVLRDYHDLSYDEIARVLDVPRGTVMSRLHRARRALAEVLAPGGRT
jgi:RNA polymerase sigma-70 factor (ECF subfamily)